MNGDFGILVSNTVKEVLDSLVADHMVNMEKVGLNSLLILQIEIIDPN